MKIPCELKGREPKGDFLSCHPLGVAHVGGQENAPSYFYHLFIHFHPLLRSTILLSREVGNEDFKLKDITDVL